VIARWFEARRPLALSIAATGLSLGGVLITPLAAKLLASEGLGRSGIVFGVAFFVGIVPVVAAALRTPRQGELVRESLAATKDAGAFGAGSVTWRRAIRTRFFLALTIAYVFALGAQVGGITHLYLLTSARGHADIASSVVSAVAIASIIGRLGGGWLLLKLSSRNFAMAVFALQVAGIVVIAAAASKAMLIAGALVFGSTVGNVLMLQSLLLAEAFGPKQYGRIYSLSQFIGICGVATAPVLVGAIFESSGDYQLAYLVIAVGALLGLVALALAGPVPANKHARIG
jgi:cyanate permease